MKPIDCESLYRDPRHYDLQHKDFDAYSFGMSIVPQLYTLMNSPIVLASQFMVYSVDGAEPEMLVGIGLGLDDLIHAQYSMW
ncbi:MAG: hypothetical protein DRP27_10240 [Thermotogae bacterium]|nr:MAG: hypothetical protein DRP27_10240 [Thermotogota bacterium]